MTNNKASVSRVLTEIIGVAIEYELHLEPNKFMNLMDLYSCYLRTGCNSNGVGNIAEAETTVDFHQFISNQSLLNSAALLTEIETGEPLIAPTALRPRYSRKPSTNVTPPISVTKH